MDWITALVGAVPALLTQAGNEWHKRRLKARLEEEAKQRFAEQQALLVEKQELLAGREEHITKLNAALARESEQARVHREMNEKFDKKAEEAWTLYQQSGIQAGNAQSMLLREVESLVMAVNKYRIQAGEKPLRVNPQLKDIVSEFKGAHVREVVEAERQLKA